MRILSSLILSIPVFFLSFGFLHGRGIDPASQAFTQVAEKAMPATVSIKVQLPQQEPREFLNPFDMFGGDLFRHFFGQQFPFPSAPTPQEQAPPVAAGTGFFISSDGYVVTNHHVVQDATQITVILEDGKEYPATVKGTDIHTDLAVLKVDAPHSFPALQFGSSDELKVGEWVVAIGNPFGLEATLTAGIVSAKGRQQEIGKVSYVDFIQTDAAINPGNSGGPLLNLEGEVIGINTAIFSKSGGYMGIGFAIPSKMAEGVVSQILENGSVSRAYLGIVLQTLDAALADAAGIDKQDGVLIADVMKDSPAEKAGLKSGDIILQYNGIKAKNGNKLRSDIGMMRPGDSLQLQILRGEKKESYHVTLGAKTDEEAFASEMSEKLGVEVENLTPEMSTRLGYSQDVTGVVITKVKPGSPAAAAGLRPNYLITGAAIQWQDQRPIRNTSDFDAALKELGAKKSIILIVRHQNFQKFYTLKVP